MRTSSRVEFVLWLAIGGLLAAGASYRSIIPGVNEPHYLTKARHFWDNDWCRQDLFLASANAHWCFYAAVGWLAAVFSFPVAAWVGRIAGWLTLAWGWQSLGRVLLPDRSGVLFSAILWTALAVPEGLSGEWILGGVESKVFAYGLLLAGVAALLRGDHRWGALWLGLAIAFHPLVGGWGLVALVLGLLNPREWSLSGKLRSSVPQSAPGSEPAIKTGGGRLHGLSQSLPSLLILVAASLPGMVPALRMLLSAPSAEVAAQGNRIQVVERLSHHLIPWRFSVSETAWSAALLVICGVAALRTPRGGAWRPWRGMIAGSAVIAALGWLGSATPWWIAILKFYPFRLLDGLLPVAVALELQAGWPGLRSWIGRRSPALATGCGALILTGAVATPFLWPAFDRVQPRWKPVNRAAWQDVCDWVRRETEPDALFLTPRFSFGFKWWAERAEYAVWKDCPQDAASLVEWKRRLDRIAVWRQTHFPAGLGTSAVDELAAETGIDYIVAWNQDPFSLEPVYRNPVFSVYRIRTGNVTSDAASPN